MNFWCVIINEVAVFKSLSSEKGVQLVYLLNQVPAMLPTNLKEIWSMNIIKRG